MDRAKLEGEPIAVPLVVLEGIEALRQTGLVNMIGRDDVVTALRLMGRYEAEAWVRENPTAYAEGVFRGFVADP